MSNEPVRQVPESIREATERVVKRALARCDQMKVDWEDFLRAVLAEEKLHPKTGLEELYERAFRRLEAMRN